MLHNYADKLVVTSTFQASENWCHFWLASEWNILLTVCFTNEYEQNIFFCDHVTKTEPTRTDKDRKWKVMKENCSCPTRRHRTGFLIQRDKKNPKVPTCFVFLTEKKSGYSNEKMHNIMYLFIFFHWPTFFMLTGAFGLWGELVQSVMPGFGLCEGPWRCSGGAGGGWGGRGGASEGQQPGGVEQEGIELLGVNSSMKWRLRTAALDFGQQVLNLFDRYQDLLKREQIEQQWFFFLA